jgi:phage-related protein
VNELSNTTAKNLQAAHSISTAGSSQSVSNTQYQELVVLQQYTAHLTEKYKRLLADYKQHMAYFTEKHEQLSVNYEELRANYEQQLRANDEQLRVNYEQQQLRANYE